LTIPTGAGIIWSKPFFLINCFAAPLFLLIVSETTHVTIPMGPVDFPLWGLMLILSTIIAVVVFFTSKIKESPKYFFVLVGLNIVMSSSWLYMVGLEIVSVLVIMAKVINMSPVTVGILFLGLANSYIAITRLVKLSRQGLIIMAAESILAVFPLKLMLCLGVPFIISSIFTTDPGVTFSEESSSGYNPLLLMLGGLLAVGVVYAVVIPILRFQLKMGLGVLLVGIWLTGVVVVVLAEVGVIFGGGPILSRSVLGV